MFLMPSGHNTQPWKFRIADNAIMIEDILFYQIEKRQTNRSYRIRLKNVFRSVEQPKTIRNIQT